MNLKHVAVIMDGNGRWAKAKGKNRTYGHAEGAKRIKDILSFCKKDNIKYLTLFAFSCENFNRPISEVMFLFQLLAKYLTKENANKFNEQKVRFHWIGFSANLPKQLVTKLRKFEEITSENDDFHLTIAFNYGGIQDLEQAAKNTCEYKSIKEKLMTNFLPPVDLLIRTGNEKRISNFLLYDLAYAEIIFEEVMWPEYNETTWNKNISEFNNRKRRFGAIKDESVR